MKFTRRQFLRGSGAALALPLLPSLLPRTARAAVAAQKNFVGIGAWAGRFRTHGPQSQLMPITPAPVNGVIAGMEAVALPGKFTVHRGLLTAMTQGGKISEIIDTRYTPDILKKMFMLQGFDYLSMAAAHHDGQFGAHNKNTGQGTDNLPTMATIDHVLADYYRAKGLPSDVVAYSATPLDSTVEYGCSWRADGSPAQGRFTSPATLWEKYFGGASIPASTKTLLIDQVLEDYKSVRVSPRLGSEDRQRLDDHIAHLAATETKLKRIDGVCRQLQPNKSISDRKLIMTTMNDVIVGLISCGLASTFMGWARAYLDPDPGTWHTWSHEAFMSGTVDTGKIEKPAMYATMIQQNRDVIADLGLDLAKKLDAVGQLDNTVIMVIQEHSFRGHEPWNVSVVGFGSAGGAFATNLYADYRSLAEGRSDGISDSNAQTTYGFPINQLYANVLQAMGMAPADYEQLNRPRAGWSQVTKPGSGYGCPSIHPDHVKYVAFAKHYTQFFSGHDMSAKLPLWRT